MKTLRIALAAALLTTGGSAFAQSATDVQCLILSNALANQAKDDNEKRMAQSSFYFYLGRIGVAATAPQLKALLDQQIKTITSANADGLMNGCMNAIGEKVKLVQGVAGQTQPQAGPQARPQAQPQKKPEGR
jgi:hypothetical protein